jgi:peptidoglycan/xylan/chitin deacetylase (PgdA/CDA1 family)
MKRTQPFFLLILLLLTGCASTASAISPVDQTAVADSINHQLQETITAVILARTPTITLTPQYTPTATSTPTPLPTATPTITPTWAQFESGKLIAPILLYHHVHDIENPGRYDISISAFQSQMEYLKSWGYTTVSVSTIAKVLREGGPLPEKPIVISFDDGNEDIYQNAFPIMKSLGFTGTTYIVTNRIGSKDFVNADEIKQLYDAGWEIGSHTRTHQDLVKNAGSLDSEGRGSKEDLESKLGIRIDTFAYPFGAMETLTANEIAKYGYTSAVGLGVGYIQYPGILYYLTREEIQNSYDLNKFAQMLPWSPLTTPIPLNTP